MCICVHNENGSYEHTHRYNDRPRDDGRAKGDYHHISHHVTPYYSLSPAFSVQVKPPHPHLCGVALLCCRCCMFMVAV